MKNLRELVITCIHKDFQRAYSQEWRTQDINKLKGFMKKRGMFKRHMEQYLGGLAGGILRFFPKNWKSYEEYKKEYIKVMETKMKEMERRTKKGEKQMTEKEWNKDRPMFYTTQSEKDLRIIIALKNGDIKALPYNSATVDWFKKLINKI